MSESFPVSLSMTPAKHLQIVWDNGETRVYSPQHLREHCPCAHCQAKRLNPQPKPLLQVLKIEDTIPLAITRLHTVGNYAYGIDFSDGHNSGIFTLELLRQIGVVQTTD